MSPQPPNSTYSIYRDLKPDRQDIRLVKLLPSEDRKDPLVCYLETVPLGSSPHFHSLSYAWGQWKAEVPLKIGDRQLFITVNLENALRAVRKAEEPILLWIDAICINQQNLKERNHQVQLMRQIFTTAVTVNIWLGIPFPGAQEAFEALNQLASGVPLGMIVLKSQLKTTSVIENLTAIFKYQWWQRLWVRIGSTLLPWF